MTRPLIVAHGGAVTLGLGWAEKAVLTAPEEGSLPADVPLRWWSAEGCLVLFRRPWMKGPTLPKSQDDFTYFFRSNTHLLARAL